LREEGARSRHILEALLKIALIGASGFVGSKILSEALRRGHQVTAIIRRPQRIAPHPNLTVVQGDVLHRDELARVLAGHDVVISSYNPARGAPRFSIGMSGVTARLSQQ
jgi:putative NADH-flavin reductase